MDLTTLRHSVGQTRATERFSHRNPTLQALNFRLTTAKVVQSHRHLDRVPSDTFRLARSMLIQPLAKNPSKALRLLSMLAMEMSTVTEVPILLTILAVERRE